MGNSPKQQLQPEHPAQRNHEPERSVQDAKRAQPLTMLHQINGESGFWRAGLERDAAAVWIWAISCRNPLVNRWEQNDVGSVEWLKGTAFRFRLQPKEMTAAGERAARI